MFFMMSPERKRKKKKKSKSEEINDHSTYGGSCRGWKLIFLPGFWV